MLKWIEVDLTAVAENCRAVKKLLAPGVRFQAVVKEDGYGHGAAQIARTALAEGADSLGVLTVDEAAALRKAGTKAPLQLLAPPLPDEAEETVGLDAVCTVDSTALLDALDKAARKPQAVIVDIDFGLGRWGIPRADLSKFLREVAKRKKLRLHGISTHLGYVAGKNAVEAEEKLRAFAAFAKTLKRARPGAVAQAANSTLLVDFPHRQFDGVRVGNLLYGINRASRPFAVKRPWRFYARIIAIKDVRKGTHLGYGSEYIAPRAMKVAALPAGYADGLTMEPAERLIGLGSGYRYWGMLGEEKAPFLGRVGIAHTLVDVTSAPSARIGDAVLLPIRRTAANARIPRLYET